MSEVNSEHRLSYLERQYGKIDDTCRLNNDRLIKLENTVDVMGDKLDGLSKHTEAIVGMGYEVKNMAVKVEDVLDLIGKQNKLIDKQGIEISNIRDKPGQIAIKMWVFVGTGVGTAILGGFIGYLIK